MDARNYQIELYKQAQKRNVIIKLDTGSGKTYIALLLIEDYLKRSSTKKIFFLVKNASLGSQHQKYLQKHLFLDKEIGLYHGQLEHADVDLWTKNKWTEYISKHKIIIITAKVFLDILLHCKYTIDNVSLLIFDEVHHLNKNDDYAQIAETISNAKHLKVLGLTACILMNPKSMDDIQFVLEELELKLKCSVITTKRDISHEFAVNLTEKFVYFKREKDETIEQIIEVQVGNFEESNIQQSSIRYDDKLLDINSVTKTLKAFMRLHNACGNIPLLLVLLVYESELGEIISLELDGIVKKSYQKFQTFVVKFKEYIQYECIKHKKYHSDKIEVLIDLLKKYQKVSKSSQKGFSILIFVKERMFALAIDLLFKSLIERKKLSKFFTSQFITGHNLVKFPRELYMSTKRQEMILKDFRDKKCNILIATNVIEEGLDVPSCNVVIKFDEVNEFRSYVQSKGRARAKRAYFNIFCPTGEGEKIKNRIQLYKMYNMKINEYLKTRAIDYNGDHKKTKKYKSARSEFDYAPFGSSGPKITLSTAASVLDRYIGRLRCNSISVIKRIYEFDINKDVVTLTLPMPSPCRDEITVPKMCNKRASKEMVNLMACKVLHQKYRELNDKDLLPKERLKDLVANMDINAFNNEQSLHPKPIAETLTANYQNGTDINSNKCFYLYTIHYSPDILDVSGLSDFKDIEEHVSLAFIVKRKISEVNIIKFPISLIGGKCTVTVSNKGRIGPFSKKQKDIFEKTHCSLFELYKERINKFQSEIYFNPQDHIFQMNLILLRNNEIDFDYMYDFIYTPRICSNLAQSRKISKWKGCVVRPIYNPKEFGSFIVKRVRTDLTPNSFVHNGIWRNKGRQSYNQYFLSTYGSFFSKNTKCKLSEDEKNNLPMVETRRIITIMSALNRHVRTPKTSRRIQKMNDPFVHVPAFLEVISLRAKNWMELCLFPTIHYRLNQMLVTVELSKHRVFSKFVDWSEMKNMDCELILPPCLDSTNVSDLIEVSVYSVHPNDFLKNFLPAITSLTCHESFSLELLEIFGDSFLKYASSRILYQMNSEDNEGSLSTKRIKMVCNKRLYEVSSKEIGLEKYFFNTLFDTKSNYIFPMYKDVDNCLQNVLYKNKSLSDCFEAILGTIVINYGEDNGFMFLNEMNLDPLNKMDFTMEDSSVYDWRLDDKTIQSAILERQEWIEELEGHIMYKFKNKALLIEAITHPTSQRNRLFGCYQRLEFLGDAVIDYLITVYIMYRKPDYNPGKITGLRSALVNNNTFAYVAVINKLHKFIDYQDVHMNVMLPDAIETIEKFNLDLNDKFSPDGEGLKVIYKVLGDIFESIIGAVYVDTNYETNEVWPVIRRMMEVPLRNFIRQTPRNKIVQLHEKYPNMEVSYEIDEFTNLFMMTAILDSKKSADRYDSDNVVIVQERNKRLCKSRLANLLIT